MWLLLLGGLVPLFLLAGADDSTPKYMLVLPARLTYPSSEKLCMDLSNVKKSVVLNITLETTANTHTLLDNFIWHKKQLKCFTFPVPSPADGTEEVVTIRLSGAKGKINERKQVLIQKAPSNIFVQLDKPIYKPGQLVRFRIITIDSSFMTLDNEYRLVELQDPERNRIAQWLNVKPDHGIVQLFFQLPSEPSLGTYTISVDNKAFMNFDVKEYVPLNVEVTMEEPVTIFSADSNFPLKVCGRFTYGKPIQGSVHASVCQKAYAYYWRPANTTPPNPTDICRNYSGQTDKTGCFFTSVELSQFRLGSYEYSRTIDVTATLEEAGTGVKANVSRQIYISDQAGSMNFVDTDNFYHEGHPFSGKLKVLKRDGSVWKNQQVFLVVNLNNNQASQVLTTDNVGVATFVLDTAAWKGSGVTLEGRFHLENPVYESGKINQYYQNAYLYLQPYYTTTKSYAKIRRLPGLLPCEQKQEIWVDYSFDGNDLGKGAQAKRATFSYYVSGKGKILLHGQKNVNFKNGAHQGSFSILVTFTSDFAPRPSLVVYSLFPDGGVIADKIELEVSMCFKNQVSLGFSQPQQLPGATLNLQLKAFPRSLCAVRAVDQSILLLSRERELSNESVYNMFYVPGGYPYQVSEYDRCYPPGPVIDPIPMPLPRLSKRRIPGYWGYWNDDGVDFFSFIQAMGIKIISNYKIKKPVKCMPYGPNIRPFGTVLASAVADAASVPKLESARPALQPPSPDAAFASQVRQFFPETWLWDLYPIDASGAKQVPVTVPDSITKWKASMFCTSTSKGFGISPMVDLITFKPFFVDLTLLYSVIRGESFPLTATVFNYLDHCIKVQVNLAESENYQVQDCKDCQYISCLCADEAKSFTWNIKATKLGMVNFTVTTVAIQSEELCGKERVIVPEKGRSDTLIKSLLVKPEGVLVVKSHSSLLCPEGNSTSDSLSLQLPEDVVPDSARAQVSVLGDIMGTALQNLNQLVQMPSGCGEQNMVLFAPIIYVLQYLERTNQLSEELKTKAVGYLQSGYQRELQYKHHDGSYSAFGQSDGQGNTWLTAFVAKSFIQAKQYTFIDDKNIEHALAWLATLQQPDGCFANVGKLFHTAMKGGVNDEVSLAAYITAALLEAKKPLTDPMVKNGLGCLRKAVSNTTDVYTQALLAYVFSLAGDASMRELLLAKLDKQAIKSGGQIHWSRKPVPASSQNPWSQPESVDVETSAYVLLALLQGEKNKENIGIATGTVAWLAKQQNAFGGFSSTQDTVVALQALARYGEVTYVQSGDVSVKVRSDKAFQQTFHVDNSNRLVMQQAPLPHIPGEYQVEATGKGCAYVQTVLRYNIHPAKNADAFTLSVTVEANRQEQQTASSSLTLSITVSYVGSRGVSNMAIIEVKMLSGFHPVSDTKNSLMQQPLVKRVETGEEYLTIYLDQLGKEKQTYTFTISQDIPVKDLKPATVRVYDYYMPAEESTVEYESPL